MSYKDKLYGLLPEYYRIRDAESGGQLESLLRVIAEQADILEDDIRTLYENWFIETCRDWVIPYIGDLVAARNLNYKTISSSNPRSWVCNTIGYRRRKGTLAMLEQLAHDVTGWNTKAVEFFRLLSSTQNVNNFRNSTTVNLRDTEKLAFSNTPFGAVSHNLDVRHICNNRGKYNIQNIGLFIWRLQAYRVTNSPAHDHGEGQFTFNSLGYDMPLFNMPQTSQEFSQIVETNVPEPIQRLDLKNNLTKLYGDGRAVGLEVDGSRVTPEQIVVANLVDWENRPSDGKVAIDPVLGRILFPTNKTPKQVYVSYFFGFSSEIGSRYSQRTMLSQTGTIYYIAKNGDIRKKLPESKTFASFNDAIKKWNEKNDQHVIFEVMDSEVYEEAVEDIQVPKGFTLEIHSQEGQRPILKLTKPLSLVGADKNAYQDNSVIFDGLTIDRTGTITTLVDAKKGELGSIFIKYCTLVPSNNLQTNSLQISEGNDLLTIYVDHSISGKIDTSQSEAGLKFSASIIDGKSKQNNAISCHSVTIENCTIFGSVCAERMELARNTIFTGEVNIQHRQKGMMQFCYVPPLSVTTRRFKCQPSHGVDFTVRPIFTSEEFGDPRYAQLDLDTSRMILGGADDEDEMGVFNHLHQNTRMNNLRATLDEYMLFGLEAGIFPVT